MLYEKLYEKLFRLKLYRKAYRNWLSVLMRVKLGNGKVFAVLKDGTEMVLDKYVAMAIPNYLYYGRRDGVPKNVESITATNWAQALLKLYGWTFDGDILYKDVNGIRVTFLAYYKGQPVYLSSIAEVFDTGIYEVDVDNKDVVDIGSGIGDSVVYFSLKNAKRVVGLEPLPNVYEVAKINLSLNKDITDRAHLVNGAIAYGVKEIKVQPVPVFGSLGFSVRAGEGESGVPVKAYTLKEIAEKVDRDVLKMDCEGCEWEVLRQEADLVGEFDVVMAEFHGKSTRAVRKTLEGFLSKYKFEIVRTIEGPGTASLTLQKRG